MQNTVKLPMFTLLLMISFASVNAVLYSPALPIIADFFAVPTHIAQQTMTWFLIGYAVGQLLYGPLANRFGRKPALYAGILLQIISSLLCVAAGMLHLFPLLVVARFLLALGSGVGLKMTFTLINECYTPAIASQKTAYLMLAFGITPGLSIALGGLLDTHYGWISCFYAGTVYGLILLVLTFRLPETQKNLDQDALKLNHLLPGYQAQFKNSFLMAGALIMGACTSFIYIFAAAGPFIAINLFGLNSAQYGNANIIPSFGFIFGSIYAAYLAKRYPLAIIIRAGIFITCAGTLLMLILFYLHASAIAILFLPLLVIYFGLSLILPNASAMAMSHTQDKSHGAAVMTFMNMGSATVIVLLVGLFSISKLLLPLLYIALCLAMIGLYFWIKSKQQPVEKFHTNLTNPVKNSL